MSFARISRLLSRKTINILSRNYAAGNVPTEAPKKPTEPPKPRNLDDLLLILASPSQVFYESVVVRQVDVPSTSGCFGILPRHIPTLAVLLPGVVTVYENDGKTIKKIFVSSGTITVNADSTCQILAEEACFIERLDPNICKSLLDKAIRDFEYANTEKSKAEAEIAKEVCEALVFATMH